jgi:uncharacterized protein (DUF58 family)
MIDGYLAGRHQAPDPGSSTEFRDYREYTPGDDLARVDWRVFARSDRHYIRTFEQETNTGCTILLDASASMGYGDKVSKLEYASFFAAGLAYLVTRSSDRVALQVFDENIRHHFPAGSTMQHLHNMMHALENAEPGQKTSISNSLNRAATLIPRRGTLVVLSDFFDDPAEVFRALNPFIHRRFDIHLIHVLTPEELELPDQGLVSFDDLESGQKVVVHIDSVREAYQTAMQQRISQLRALCVRRHIQYTAARTDRHFHHLYDAFTR